MVQPTIDKFSRPLQGPIRGVPIAEDPEWERLLREQEEDEKRLEQKEKQCLRKSPVSAMPTQN